MKSKISESKSGYKIEICKQMTPEERLVAFFYHSRLVTQMHQAGVHFRSRSKRTLQQKASRKRP